MHIFPKTNVTFWNALQGSHGITQSQLAKDFKIGGNKMFYVLKSLEARGLVMRQATIVRTQSSLTENALLQPNNNVPIVTTNLVHLTRYMKEQALGSHQRFEIRSSNCNVSDMPPSVSGDTSCAQENSSKGDGLYINDDFPAMAQVCERLEVADGKVLVVSDLKLDLGYRFAHGHRHWRRLMKRLQDAGYVEVFSAKIAESKIASCIRLLKSFDAKTFGVGNDGTESENSIWGARRGQVTEQVVEVPLDRQIYDLIDSAGPEGLYMTDIWKKMGLNNKRNYYRVTNMLAMQSIVSEAVNHKRSMMYRLRTISNATHGAPHVPANPEFCAPPSVVPPDKLLPLSSLPNVGREHGGKSRQRRRVSEKRKVEVDATKATGRAGSMERQFEEEEESNGRQLDESRALVVVDTPHAEVHKGRSVAAMEISPARMLSEPLPLTVQSSFPPVSMFRSGQQYPCTPQTTTGAQRELRILQRLQEEKFVPRVELHRWLEDAEKERRGTMMDRKTLTRVLQKLQREGRCKCILLSMPGLTNCGRSRVSEVVLLPSVEIVPELLTALHDRIRNFEMNIRGQGSIKVKSDVVPELSGVTRMSSSRGMTRGSGSTVEMEAEKACSLQENGFIPAKMVRVRMLHYFLWSYISDILDGGNSEHSAAPNGGHDDLNINASSCKVFVLSAALKAMPLELFLQVIGSTRKIENLGSYCRQGLRLCDCSEEEIGCLTSTNASGRLSWLIDVLRRLKLIRLVMGSIKFLAQLNQEMSKYSGSTPEASLTYAMESQPYLEEPAPQPLSSLSLDSFDLTPRARHEFTLTSKDSLDAYWQTLEYFFSGATPTIARRAFPGSNVPELFGLRSWTSLRLMSLDQRIELMKRVEAGGIDRRITATECAAIAKNLNLSLEQVLRFSYEKNKRARLQALQKESTVESGMGDTEAMNTGGHRIKPHPSNSFKNPILLSGATSEVPHVRAYKRQRQSEIGSATFQPMISSGPRELSVTGGVDNDNQGFAEGTGDEDDDDGRGVLEDNPINYVNVVTKLKPARSRRFPWSEDLDRILVCCYARQRAMLGARIHRVDWVTMPLLPAPPPACRRRIAQLKSDLSVRKALMNLCSLLAARYMKHIQSKDAQQSWDPRIDVISNPSQPTLSAIGGDTISSWDDREQLSTCQRGLEVEQDFAWDSFEEPSIGVAVNEVMRLRRVAKACSGKRAAGIRPVPSLGPDGQMMDTDFTGKNGEMVLSNKIAGTSPEDFLMLSFPSSSSLSPFLAVENTSTSSVDAGVMHATSSDDTLTARHGALSSISAGHALMSVRQVRTRPARVRPRKRKDVPVSLNGMTSEETVQGSLGVANAVELVKLVLLNSSLKAEVPRPLVDALRRCEESHIFAAFTFIRNKELVIVGQDNQPFVLSPKFFHNASASRFPFGTGSEAISMIEWLATHNAALEESWVPLPADNLCGQLLQLLAVMAEGEVSMAPFLPSNGLGESEDNYNVVAGVKRKPEGGQEVGFVKPKIQRTQDASPGFRRERGFPGIHVCLHQASKPLGALLQASSTKGSKTSEQTLTEIFEQANTAPVVGDCILESGIESEEVPSVNYTDSTEANTELLESGIVKGDDISRLSVVNVVDEGIGVGHGHSSVLADCIQHFCQVSKGGEDMNDSEGFNLKPLFLEAVLDIIEDAGAEGLSISHLTESLTRIGVEATEELAAASVHALAVFDLVKQVPAYDHLRVIAAAHSAHCCLQVKTGTSVDNGCLRLAVSEEENMDSANTIIGGLNDLVTRHWSSMQLRNPPGLLKDNSGHRRVLIHVDKDANSEEAQSVPILPWLTPDGGTNSRMLKALSRRVMGMVMLNPGVTEDQLVEHLDVLNPQTARQLLEILELDGHVKVRTILQPSPALPPRLLCYIMQENSATTKPSWTRHYYANVLSASLL
ncbi:hypothetical protein CY35_05G096600 [Sphagnum magellanicum]|nr:hypothetical protein CY35_05G096600 [Sphagnum magellanicum]